MVVKTMTAIHESAAGVPKSKLPAPRAGTKQAILITILRVPDGAAMEPIIAATGWLPHPARGAMSSALGKKLGLIVTSLKKGDEVQVYRIDPWGAMIPRLLVNRSVQQPVVNLGRLARGTVDRDHVLRAG